VTEEVAVPLLLTLADAVTEDEGLTDEEEVMLAVLDVLTLAVSEALGVCGGQMWGGETADASCCKSQPTNETRRQPHHVSSASHAPETAYLSESCWPFGWP
jgi:hypothetical protein